MTTTNSESVSMHTGICFYCILSTAKCCPPRMKVPPLKNKITYVTFLRH